MDGAIPDKGRYFALINNQGAFAPSAGGEARSRLQLPPRAGHQRWAPRTPARNPIPPSLGGPRRTLVDSCHVARTPLLGRCGSGVLLRRRVSRPECWRRAWTDTKQRGGSGPWEASYNTAAVLRLLPYKTAMEMPALVFFFSAGMLAGK